MKLEPRPHIKFFVIISMVMGIFSSYLILADQAFAASSSDEQNPMDESWIHNLEDFKRTHEAMVSLIIDIEQKTEYGNLYPIEGKTSFIQDNFLHRLKSHLSLPLISKAHARIAGLCFFGGWPSQTEGNKCKEPWKYDMSGSFSSNYDSSSYCGSPNLFRCNPVLFGPGDGEFEEDYNNGGLSKGKCIDYKSNGGSLKSITEQCAEATLGNIENLHKRLKTDRNYLRDFLKYREELGLFCEENPSYDGCTFLLGRVVSIERRYLCLREVEHLDIGNSTIDYLEKIDEYMREATRRSKVARSNNISIQELFGPEFFSTTGQATNNGTRPTARSEKVEDQAKDRRNSKLNRSSYMTSTRGRNRDKSNESENEAESEQAESSKDKGRLSLDHSSYDRTRRGVQNSRVQGTGTEQAPWSSARPVARDTEMATSIEEEQEGVVDSEKVECKVPGQSRQWVRNCEKLYASGIPKEALDYALKVMRINANSFRTNKCFVPEKGLKPSNHVSMQGLTADKFENELMKNGLPNKCQFMINDLKDRKKSNGCRAKGYFIDLCKGDGPEVVSQYHHMASLNCSAKGKKYNLSNVGAFFTHNQTFDFTDVTSDKSKYRSIANEVKENGGKREAIALQLVGIQRQNNNSTLDGKYIHVGSSESSNGVPTIDAKNYDKIEEFAKNGPSLVVNFANGNMEDIEECSQF